MNLTIKYGHKHFILQHFIVLILFAASSPNNGFWGLLKKIEIVNPPSFFLTIPTLD